MEYESFDYTSKTEVEKLLETSDNELKIQAIIGMINGIPDRIWIQEKLLELVTNEDFWVAKNAITGLGDLARIYGELDMMKVHAAFLEVKNADLKVIIDETLEDFRIFLKYNN